MFPGLHEWVSHSLGTLGTGRLSLPCYYPYATKRVAAPPFQVAKVSLWGEINIGTQPKRKALKILKNISFSPLPVEVEISKCVFMDIENMEFPSPH